MKNADAPAMPNALAQPTNDGFLSTEGLTKREHFAAMAMQGLLAGGYCIDDARNRLIDVPEEAVNLADTLLAQLERADG